MEDAAIAIALVLVLAGLMIGVYSLLRAPERNGRRALSFIASLLGFLAAPLVMYAQVDRFEYQGGNNAERRSCDELTE